MWKYNGIAGEKMSDEWDGQEEDDGQNEEDLTEQFETRTEELCEYGALHNLKAYFVRPDLYRISCFKKLENIQIHINEITLSSDYAELDIKSTIMKTCLKNFDELVEYLKSNNRLLETSDYGKYLFPKFRHKELKKAILNQTGDYLIMKPVDDGLMAILPVSLASNKDSWLNDDGKEIVISEFPYFMFFKNDKEVEKVVRVFCNATKRFNTIVENIEQFIADVSSEFIANNPKPEPYHEPIQTSSGIFSIFNKKKIEKQKEDDETKEVEASKKLLLWENELKESIKSRIISNFGDIKS
jgi:hypothetical protein